MRLNNVAPNGRKIFARFVGVGALATLLQYVLLVFMVELLNTAVVFASVLAYAISAILNYTVNYYLTFNSTSKHHIAAGKFAIMVLVALGLTYCMMHALVNCAAINYIVAQMISTAIVLVVNYLLSKYWVFKISSNKA